MKFTTPSKQHGFTTDRISRHISILISQVSLAQCNNVKKVELGSPLSSEAASDKYTASLYRISYREIDKWNDSEMQLGSLQINLARCLSVVGNFTHIRETSHPV